MEPRLLEKIKRKYGNLSFESLKRLWVPRLTPKQLPDACFPMSCFCWRDGVWCFSPQTHDAIVNYAWCSFVSLKSLVCRSWSATATMWWKWKGGPFETAWRFWHQRGLYKSRVWRYSIITWTLQRHAKWMVRGATKQPLRVQTPPLAGGCWNASYSIVFNLYTHRIVYHLNYTFPDGSMLRTSRRRSVV